MDAQPMSRTMKDTLQQPLTPIWKQAKATLMAALSLAIRAVRAASRIGALMFVKSPVMKTEDRGKSQIGLESGRIPANVCLHETNIVTVIGIVGYRMHLRLRQEAIGGATKHRSH
jgi:ATP:corrinoid adenosyltransferase